MWENVDGSGLHLALLRVLGLASVAMGHAPKAGLLAHSQSFPDPFT